MSRSRRKRPIGGWTSCVSEKDDKRIHNRKFRRISRTLIRSGRDDKLPIDPNEVSNVWNWGKDGKSRFDPLEHPRLMRK